MSGVIKVIYVFSYVELITVYFFTVRSVLSAITCIDFLQKYPKCLHIDAIAFLVERYDARENLQAEGNTLLGIRGILRLCLIGKLITSIANTNHYQNMFRDFF